MSSVGIYEVSTPGSLTRIAIAEAYADNNTIGCDGEGRPERGGECAEETAWQTIWSGTSEVQGSAQITSPPVCPMAFNTQTVRLEFDTSVVSGYKAFDAAQLTGTDEPLAGLVFAHPETTYPNRVEYAPLPGVHGTDSFEFKVSDCEQWGEAVNYTVAIEPPTSDFSTAFLYDMQNHDASGYLMDIGVVSNDVVVEVDVEAVMMKIREEFGEADKVQVEFRAMAKFSISENATSASLALGDVVKVGTDEAFITLGNYRVVGEHGLAELWLTPIQEEVPLDFTFRIIYVSCPLYHAWEIDESAVEGGQCVSCVEILGRNTTGNAAYSLAQAIQTCIQEAGCPPGFFMSDVQGRENCEPCSVSGFRGRYRPHPPPQTSNILTPRPSLINPRTIDRLTQPGSYSEDGGPNVYTCTECTAPTTSKKGASVCDECIQVNKVCSNFTCVVIGGGSLYERTVSVIPRDRCRSVGIDRAQTWKRTAARAGTKPGGRYEPKCRRKR